MMKCHVALSCHRDASHVLIDGAGRKVPGAYVCREHAIAIIDEYARRLGWQWTAVPVDEFGNVQAGGPILKPCPVLAEWEEAKA